MVYAIGVHLFIYYLFSIIYYIYISGGVLSIEIAVEKPVHDEKKRERMKREKEDEAEKMETKKMEKERRGSYYYYCLSLSIF